MNDLWPPEPPRKRRIDAGLLLQVLLAIVALSAAGWFIYREFEQPPEVGQPGNDNVARSPESSPGSSANRERNDQILTCTADDGSVFYTNARRCEDADLGNTVNVIPAQQAEREQELSCITFNRDWETSVSFLATCREPFMQALELEKYLRRSDDPAESQRADEYCGLIADGVSAGCMATDAVFCFLPICQQRANQNNQTP